MNSPLALLRTALGQEPFRLAHFVLVMGWSGLSLLLLRVREVSLAWAGPGPSAAAQWLAAWSAGVATVVFVFLVCALVLQSLVRVLALGHAPHSRWSNAAVSPSQLALERRSIPGLSASAALAVGMVLLASVWLQWGQPTASAVLWCVGAGLELLISVVVFYRLFQASLKDKLNDNFWPTITPALLIPAVGNALVVLAGIPLGFGTWSAVQFVLGCGLWPLVWGLLMLRQARIGALPLAMLPTWCILLSPPSVVGLGLLAWQQSTLATHEPSMGWVIGAWTCWVLAAGNLWQIKPHARAVLSAPFAMAHWALSFPFAAYASLTWALFASVLTMISGGGTGSGSALLTVLAWCLGLWAATLVGVVLGILSVLSVKTLQLVLRSLVALSESPAAHPGH